MNNLRKLLVIPLSALAFLWLATPVLVSAEANTNNQIKFTPVPSASASPGEKVIQGECKIDITKPGVLIGGQITSGGFPCYITVLLRNNMPYVILVAIILVVISGLQYMTAMGAPAEQGKAKTRILGVLAGVIFYFLIQYITPLLAGGIRL